MKAGTAGQQQFREQYRAKIPAWYSGYWHIALVIISAIIIFTLLYQTPVDLSAQYAVALGTALIFGNFGEYAIHRWLGHRKSRLGKLFYARHTGDHHHFFTDHNMLCDSQRDWRVLFFPPWLIWLVSVAVILPVFGILTWIDMHAAALGWATGILATYLIYELCHYSYHLPEQHWSESLPGLKKLKQHHIQHHVPGQMHQFNFNITLPLFDKIFGTHRKNKKPDIF